MKRWIFYIVAGAIILYFASKHIGNRTREIDQQSETNEQPAQIAAPSPTPSEQPVAVPSPSALPAPETGLIEEVQRALPHIDEIKKLKTEDLHETQTITVKAALKIGQLMEAIQKDARLRADGQDFFEKCAKDNSVIASVRAVCLDRYKLLWNESNPDRPADITQFDEAIVRLSDSLKTNH